MYIIYKSKFLIMTTNFAYSVVQLLPADRIGSVMMYKIDFNKPCHIHFIGIGGISMSGLAEILLEENFTVSGSDSKETPLTDHLTRNGAQIFYGQKAANIIPGIDVVVYTAAIHEDNEEYKETKRQNLPMLSRAELLGQLMTNYDIPIAISGTHGKTTTSGLSAYVMEKANLEPSYVVGGIIPEIHTNANYKSDKYFIAELDESDGTMRRRFCKADS